MKEFSPYNIAHIDLSEQLILRRPNLDTEGSYTVLWWKEIVLGSFFLERDEEISENEYHNKIVKAIVPVINFYAGKNNNTPACDWNEFSLTNNNPLWKSRLDVVLAPWLSKHPPETIPISVIVCTRNRPALLNNCLNRLMESTPPPQEIIVVDNAPDDNSTKDVVSQFPQVLYILEPRPGLDIARNRGIEESSKSIIAFTDDDMEVHQLWAYRVWETFKDDSIAAMTGLVFAAVLNTEAELVFEKYWSFNRGYIDKTYDEVYFSASLPKGPPVWEIGGGGNMAIRRSVFDEVGYFHELLGAGAAGGSDDSEMLFRILARGKNIQYNPRAVAYHAHRKEISELKKQIFSYMRGFTAALLWQDRQRPDAGYKRNLLVMLARYAVMSVKGFPRYKARSQTVWVEIKGVIAGFAYFYKKENAPHFLIKR